MTDTKPMPPRMTHTSAFGHTNYVNESYVLALEADYRVLRAALTEITHHCRKDQYAINVAGDTLAVTHDIGAT